MKKIYVLLVSLVIISIFFVVKSTYAYYVDNKNYSSTFNIAKWNIVLNETDITEELTNTFTVEDMQFRLSDETDVSMSNGKLAPGMEGEFEILLDPTGTQVSLTYEMIIDTSLIDGTNIIVSYVKANDETLTLIDGKYIGEIDVNNMKSVDIFVGIKWLDTEDNNESDTELGSVPNRTIELPVSIKLSQKV